eukprot:Colp12_sorted_trinity150504_noHs@6018
MKAIPGLDYENDWKLVTIWIGGNDLCAICKGDVDYTPEKHTAYIEQTLDYLLANMPRVFVNLVLAIDVTKLYKVHDGLCDTYHKVVCPCSVQKNQADRDAVSAAAKEYQQLVNALSFSKKYERDDFAVVAQPFFIETDVPNRADGTPDRSYFAPDCFHFTDKAHEAAAIALWNNMIEPVGQKRLFWSPGEPIECPTSERPFLMTNKNSKASKVQTLAAMKVADLTVPAPGPVSSGNNSSTKALVAAVSVCGGVAFVAAVVFVIFTKRRVAYSQMS